MSANRGNIANGVQMATCLRVTTEKWSMNTLIYSYTIMDFGISFYGILVYIFSTEKGFQLSTTWVWGRTTKCLIDWRSVIEDWLRIRDWRFVDVSTYRKSRSFNRANIRFLKFTNVHFAVFWYLNYTFVMLWSANSFLEK